MKIKRMLLLLIPFTLLAGTIDLDNLFNYSTQPAPNYFFEESPAPGYNQTDDKIATLGRVLFYDKHLSSNDQVSCASCHKQENAFGLLELQGTGVNGLTLRRPMRIANLSFNESTAGLFWDERTDILEDQSVEPIKDHIEMGYSGTNGDPDFSQLITKLDGISYYNTLFTFAYGSSTITEQKIAFALAQFVRSIVSFDSKLDMAKATSFSIFTADELAGYNLFNSDPVTNSSNARIGGGLACSHCHNGNDQYGFLIEKKNNGIITEINGDEVLNITKSPTLRNLFDPSGNLNGPLFHNGQATNISEVLDHYNSIVPNPPGNPNQDVRFASFFGFPMNITNTEKMQIEAFLKTLTGNDIYTNPKWSDPFDVNGDINIIGGPTNVISFEKDSRITIYPNPAYDKINLNNPYNENVKYKIYDVSGSHVLSGTHIVNSAIDISSLSKGLYSVHFFSKNDLNYGTTKFIKSH